MHENTPRATPIKGSGAKEARYRRGHLSTRCVDFITEHPVKSA